MREQPDNLKSYDIVAEAARYLGVLYANITQDTIDLVIQLFRSLNEVTVVRRNLFTIWNIRMSSLILFNIIKLIFDI